MDSSLCMGAGVILPLGVQFFLVFFLFFSLGHFSLLFATFWRKNLYFAEFWS